VGALWEIPPLLRRRAYTQQHEPRQGANLWERIHSRRGRYIRRIFIAWNTAFANEFAPTEFASN
jgi:hypothetical protein